MCKVAKFGNLDVVSKMTSSIRTIFSLVKGGEKYDMDTIGKVMEMDRMEKGKR